MNKGDDNMIAFIIFYLIVFILSFKIKKDKFTIFDIILLIMLILFSGLRGVGIDYKLYEFIFNHPFQLESRTGIGYTYLMYIYKYVLHFNYQTLIFTISTVTVSSIYYFLKKNSERPGLAILVYVSLGFYTTSFNMFRQSLSVAMVLLGSHFLNRNKKIKMFICYVGAFFIHSSSLIAIIGYILTKIVSSVKFKLKYMLPFSIVALLFYDKLFYFLINMSDNYSMYSSYDANPGIGTYINVILYLLFTIFLLIPKYRNAGTNNFQYYNLFLLGICIMVLEFKNYLFFRIAFYFTIISTIMLPSFYIQHNLKNRKIESLLFYLCLFVYYLVYISSFDGVLPYKVFFMD